MVGVGEASAERPKIGRVWRSKGLEARHDRKRLVSRDMKMERHI